MARQRTQKSVSARIDREYIHRPHRWRKFRLTTVFAATALAILFVAFTTLGGRGEIIHNPGRLTFVHARIQNDCAACHDGRDASGHSTGRFSKAVSDSACLKCHDAGIHHPNQATMVTTDSTLSPPEARSQNCTSCHVEHRGQEALVSTSDPLCLQCHADLAGKTLKPPMDRVPMSVTAFTAEGHPHFGRNLLKADKSGAMVVFDPTVLRFNHKKHIGGDKPAIGADHADMRACTYCHDPSPSAGESLVWEVGKTAFSMPGGAPAAADAAMETPRPLIEGSGRHRSMTQVNYEKDCKVCHDLGTLPGSDTAVIPHADMTLVRKAILSYITDSASPWQKYAPDTSGAKEKPLNDRIAGKLTIPSDPADAQAQMDSVTKAYKTAALSAYATPSDATAVVPAGVETKLAAAKLDAKIAPNADKTKIQTAIAATTRPADQLRAGVVAALRKIAGTGLTGEAQKKTLAAFDNAFARFNQETPDPRLLEIYVAYANDGGVSCVKCHDMAGDAAVVPPEWSSLHSPTGKAADVTDATTVFHTIPTGIPAGPRRWYVNSEFNHDAHRSMNCVECHAAALTSEKTSDILSPDMEWQGFKVDTATNSLVTAQRSCMECHHPDNAEGPGAASNCTECHDFHDRSHERTLKEPQMGNMAVSSAK